MQSKFMLTAAMACKKEMLTMVEQRRRQI